MVNIQGEGITTDEIALHLARVFCCVCYFLVHISQDINLIHISVQIRRLESDGAHPMLKMVDDLKILFMTPYAFVQIPSPTQHGERKESFLKYKQEMQCLKRKAARIHDDVRETFR